MARKPTTIWDKNGKAQNGYIENGKTYYNSGQRINEGSRVIDDGGKEWEVRNGQGVMIRDILGGTTSRKPNQSSGGYGSSIERALERQHREQQRAIREGINSAVRQNESYIPQANKSFEDAVSSAYVSREQAKAQAPEALGAMGMSGGASESALLGLNTSFENVRNTADQQRKSTIDQIQQNSANIRSTGNVSLANAGSEYASMLAQALQQQQALAQEQSNWQAQYDMQNTQQSWENDFAEKGYQNQLIQQALENQMASRGGGGTAAKKGLTFAQAMSAYESGIKTPEVISVLNEILGTNYQMEQDARGGLNTPINSQSNRFSLPKAGMGMGLNESYARQIISDYQSGKISGAKAMQLLQAIQ